MATFLELTARALLHRHGAALGDVAVVLPNQRAALYLRHALATELRAPLWSPQAFTLASFMETLSGRRVLPMEELLFEGYEAYRAMLPGAQGIEEFMQWAPITLADMSEADAHLLPLQGFYRDLRSWEELDWSFNTEPLSQGQERMVRYWATAGRLHALLNERLAAAGTATAGGADRIAAESDAPFPWSHIWFVGLNALTPAQLRVMQRAREQGIARFAWDADRYYLRAPEQEAGRHLRELIKRFGEGEVPMADELGEGKVRIRSWKAPGTVAQAWCAGELLRDRSAAERGRTTVVLADETLLPALLEALPGDIDAVNVTMGLSLAALPVGSLLAAHTELMADPGGPDMRGTRAEKLLHHPFLRSGVGEGPDAMNVEEMLNALPEELRRHARMALGIGEYAAPHDRALALLSWARHHVQGDAFCTEQLYQASLVVRKVWRLLERYGHGTHAPAWSALLTRVLRTARVGFFGEPLRGVQVMGMLESRALDHEHLIVLGAQEGKLPASSAGRSYIPFELRRAYGLPLPEEQDAVQAYNFLRSLQRSRDVVLVYPEDGTANGPSRFIVQLEHELLADLPRRSVEKKVRVPVPVRRSGLVSVPHDARTDAALRQLLTKGLTPTMLRAWLRCPLDLWFRYVAGLREPEPPGVRIAGNVLGDALHGLVEDIHKPFLGSALEAGRLLAALPGMGDDLLQRLRGSVPADLLERGQPLLQRNMAVQAAQAFIRQEAEAVRGGRHIVPLALELPLREPLVPEQGALPFPVYVRGRLDRVDERDGVVHILDLKTGRVNDRHLHVEAITLEELKGDRGYAAQLLVYAWLYMQAHPEVAAVRTGLQPMQRTSGSEGLYLRVAGEEVIRRAHLPAITAMLAQAITQLLDPALAFMHDVESEYCAFCIGGAH